MTSTQQLTALKALGKIEGFKNDLNMLGSTLGNLSLWHPAIPHRKQCDLAVQMIDNIVERFERKLVVTIVGPCGAGKSTLLKSLIGELPLLAGMRTPGEHVRIGYFDQQQLEALDLEASPALHLQRLTPEAREQDILDFENDSSEFPIVKTENHPQK